MTTEQKSNSIRTTTVPPISWNDKAIIDVCYNGKLTKSLRIKINFKTKSGCPKGISLRYTPKTNKKVFLYRYYYNGQNDFIQFEFIPGLFGILQMEEKLLNLKKQYYDPLGSFWKFNPKDNIQTEAEVLETQSKTVREVIQRLLQDNFPRKSKVGKLASVSQRQFSRIFIGNHKRFKHLQFSDNDKGWGITELDGGLTWETFWSKYPPKNSDVSIYDNASLGPLLIDNLTKSVVRKFLNAKERTPGGKKNLIKALQCLWNYAINQDFFGDNIPQDPTKDINIVVDDESNFEGSKWNEKSFDDEERELLDTAFIKIAKTRPFQSECLMLLACAEIRPEEALKLKKSDVTKDEDGNPIIKVRKEIRKARGKGRTIDLIIDINKPVERVLNRLKRQYKRHSQYKFIPWLFPHTVIDWGNPKDFTTDKTRLKTLRTPWEDVRKLTGIEGSVKTLRKTFMTLEVKQEMTKGLSKEEALIKVAKKTHKGSKDGAKTVERYYNKPTRKDQIKKANEMGKVFSFKR